MRKLLVLFLALMCCIASPAQKSKTTQRKKTTTQVQQKKTTKKTQTKKSAAKKPLTEREKMQASQKQLRQDIEKKKKQKAELDRRVKQQMQDVLVLGGEIDDKKRLIDTIRTHIASLDSALVLLNAEKKELERQLAERQQRYVKSMRYMYRNRNKQSKMMFVFSAKNVNQMYRRTRFMKEYSTYQKAQGEAVKIKQAQVTAKQQEIESNRQAKNVKLRQGETEQQNLEKKQAEQKQMVVKLQKEQRTVQELIKKEQQQEAELNAKIEKLIAEEIAREKARIEAEKKRKAEELARKERERKEREKRLAEAKAKEEAAKAQARAAKTEREKAEAARRAKEAEQVRVTAERHVAESKKEIDNFVNADPDLIQQVIYNLTENAVKFVDEGGYIEYVFYSNEGKTSLAVRNSGSGLKKNEMNKVFDRFYKTDESRGKDTTGVGLGLSIVRSIIRLHSGDIQVSSVEGEYTEFEFTI